MAGNRLTLIFVVVVLVLDEQGSSPFGSSFSTTFHAEAQSIQLFPSASFAKETVADPLKLSASPENGNDMQAESPASYSKADANFVASPVRPTLPEQFHVVVEWNDLTKNKTVLLEEWYDEHERKGETWSQF